MNALVISTLIALLVSLGFLIWRMVRAVRK